MMNNRKNNLKKVNAMFIAAATFALLVTGCSSDSVQETEVNPEVIENAETSQISVEETSAVSLNHNSDSIISPIVNQIPENPPFTTNIRNLFTEHDLKTDYEITESIDLNEITDSVLTITQEGVFELSGKFDGQIRINCDDGKVQLVLNNAEITCSTGSAIYVENAKKVFITLADDSENTILGRTDSVEDTDSVAAIWSSSSLTINGTGVLIVLGNKDGIVSKDDLVITGGKIMVLVDGNGVRGKDSVVVYDVESLQIEAGGDGLKANSTDEGKGFIYIQNGELIINAQEDGIQAESELIITDGTIDIISGGGTDNAEIKYNDMPGRGRFNMQNTDSADSAEESVSVKSVKSGSIMYISGGEISLNTADDALHSNGSLYINGGNLQIAAGNKGIHADANVNIFDGVIEISQSYEGIEAADISVSGGTIIVNSSDDGFNASDGSDHGARGDAVNASLMISGGDVYINAEGDGLDSNGMMTFTGGTILIDGPQDSGNGALDSNKRIICSGGTLITVGSSGMAEYPDEATQNVIVITLDNYQNADTQITLLDENGTGIIDYSPSKKFDSIILSSAELESGKTYTLYLNGTESGSVTLEDPISFIGESRSMGMFGGGMMGGHGFGRDQKPDDMQIPTDENGEFDRSQMKGGMREKNFNPDERIPQNG